MQKFKEAEAAYERALEIKKRVTLLYNNLLDNNFYKSHYSN